MKRREAKEEESGGKQSVINHGDRNIRQLGNQILFQ
jgi:hypothetical protein